MSDTFHWGTEVVDVRKKDLPAIKAGFLVEHAPDSGHLVEIGCGGGKMLRTLGTHRPKLLLHGCDIRDPQVAPVEFEFSPIRGTDLPYANSSMDAVAIMDVLEHVPDPKKLISEVARILKPGGKLVSFVPVEGEKASAYTVYRLFLGQDLYERTKEHTQSFTHDGLRELLDARFQPERVQYAYHALGQVMDATMFALLRLPGLGKLFWRENAYYNTPSKPSLAGRVLNTALSAGNHAAWIESTWLKNQKATAAGLLYVGTKRS